MEWVDEKTQTQESARGGTWPARWLGPQRSETARQPRKWPQGRPGQKPQEDSRCPAQRAAAAPGSQKEFIQKLIDAICARFGERAIGLGEGGFRSEGLRHARTA
jgi:hypothetical protein